jgi:predicted nucleic acid-binding protein
VTITGYHEAYVLDASVAVKWFSAEPEPERAHALGLRARRFEGRCRLIVPEFFLLEVMNALRKQRAFTEADVAAALTALENLHLEVFPTTWDLLRKANAISWSYGAAVYDAAYVALAEVVGFPLITADDALVKKMHGHSIVLRLKDLRFS